MHDNQYFCDNVYKNLSFSYKKQCPICRSEKYLMKIDPVHRKLLSNQALKCHICHEKITADTLA